MSDKVFGLIVAVFFNIVSFVVGILLGARISVDDLSEKAIKAGAAHWTINSQTGERKFEFISPPNKTGDK